jgi:anti-sigma28 factor (negative regulator of flagellin synthesis)
MVRVAKQIDPKRIEELKKKIQDRRYLEAAIARLAQTLTNELVRREQPLGREHEF